MNLIGRIERGCWFAPMLAWAVSLLVVGPAATRAADRAPAVPVTPAPVWVGTGSCSAMSCHNGRREPLDLTGSEYSFFGAYDPHNRAFAVLYDDRSKVIERNYRRLATIDQAKPTEDVACLRCHVHQDYDHQRRSVAFEVADGVGCEGCHGPGERYLVPHVQAGWRSYTDQQKQDLFGLRPLRDLQARGQMCTECHVGIGATDVNHDLIAAGHPRLNFEYASQMGKYPKHWRVRDDQLRHPDYEAKVWALGQLIAAKAALDLLESRAVRSLPDDSTTPWPELAEYSCFSCHHDLTPKGWAGAVRAPDGPKDGRIGVAPWGSWYLPMTATLAAGRSLPEWDDPASALGSIRQVMAARSPDPKVVARRARLASEEVGRVLDALNRDQLAPGAVRAMLLEVSKPDAADRPLDWDHAARQYLAVVALDRAMATSDPRYSDLPIRRGLGQLLADLDLPVRVPRRDGLFDSPVQYRPEAFKAGLGSVRSALPDAPR